MDPETRVIGFADGEPYGRVFRLAELDRPRWHAETAPVTLYRGCSRVRIKGISWTADKLTAAQFARGHRGMRVPDPVIAVATVPPVAIFAAPSGVQWDRNEAEYLVDPDMIEITETLEWPVIAEILGPDRIW